MPVRLPVKVAGAGVEIPYDQALVGKVCTVSGSGHVAQYTIEKLNDLGAKAVTLSDFVGVSELNGPTVTSNTISDGVSTMVAE